MSCRVFRVQIRQADTKRMWPGDKNRLFPEEEEKSLTPGRQATAVSQHVLIYRAYVAWLIFKSNGSVYLTLGTTWMQNLDSSDFSRALLNGAV